jgi:hypothetical protein
MKPASSPQLPRWIFFTMDAVLLAAAAFIASQSPRPLSNGAIFAVVGCVIVAAILGTIPLLVNYEREKNETLDERQRALEALAQTVAAAAEQIGIAANGLHTVVELAHKNLKQAEQLPHKLQDKMAEFQSLMANSDDTEKEELEKELVALRSSESERLEGISDRIAKSTADLGKLETAAQKNLAATQEAMTKLDEKLRATLGTFDAKLAALEKTAARSSSTANPSERALAAAVANPTAESAPASAKPSDAETPSKSSVASPSKVSRSSRVEEISDAAPAEMASPVQQVEIKELPPVKLQKIVPVAPGTRPPSKITSNGTSHAPIESAPPIPPAPDTPVAAANPPRKRSEKKSSDTPPAVVVKENFGAHQPALVLEMDSSTTATAVASRPPMAKPAAAAAGADAEFTQVSPDEAAPSVAVAADGATRLLVTAYIGIGNRLFIRGSGPGLSWDKGVPLQFVSIGKWRWETSDATTPVKFKLYKNDETECAALGGQSLAPGHQQELTATF